MMEDYFTLFLVAAIGSFYYFCQMAINMPLPGEHGYRETEQEPPATRQERT